MLSSGQTRSGNLPLRLAFEGSTAVAFLIGSAPLLSKFFADLGSRPQYSFYPYVLVCAALVGWRRLRELPASNLSHGRLIVASFLFAASAFLFILGAGFYARLAAPLASLLIIAGVAWRLGGVALLRALLPAGVLVLVIIPPPGRMDLSLLRVLQAIAVAASSRTLDLLGVPHVVTGTVIDIPGHSLLVEEACSGINSLMAVVAFSLLYGFLAHRKIVRLGTLLIMAGFFVLWVNIVRIVFGAVMLVWFDVNLLDPAVHELTSIVLWAVALGLVLSADQLIGLLADRFKLGTRRAKIHIQPQSVSQPPASAEVATQPSWRMHSPGFMWWGFAAAFLAVGVFSYIRIKDCWQPSRLDGTSVFAPPAAVSGWQLQSAGNSVAKRLQSVGRYQNHWVYRRGQQVAEVSFAYPFSQGYHDATECYIYTGWKVQSRKPILVADADAEATSPTRPASPAAVTSALQAPHCLVAELAGQVDSQAQLLFAAFAEDGTWQSPPTEPHASGKIARSLQLSREAALRKPACEVQTLGVFDRAEGPTDAERAALTDLFHGVREALRLQAVDQLRQKRSD